MLRLESEGRALPAPASPRLPSWAQPHAAMFLDNMTMKALLSPVFECKFSSLDQKLRKFILNIQKQNAQTLLLWKANSTGLQPICFCLDCRMPEALMMFLVFCLVAFLCKSFIKSYILVQESNKLCYYSYMMDIIITKK